MTESSKVRFEIYSLIFIHHISLLIGLLYGQMNFRGLALFFPIYFILSRLGGDLGFHRLFSHQSYKVTAFYENLLLILGTLECKGSSLTWCSHHIRHHQYSDQEKDPHTPQKLSFPRVIYGIWPEFSSELGSLRHILKRTHYFFHKYYFGINLTFLLAMYWFFRFQAGIFLSGPILYSFYIGGLVNYFGHRPHFSSYRNHDTNDHSQNSVLLNLISLGGGMHNNHHRFPKSPINSETWYEVDPPGQISKLIER